MSQIYKNCSFCSLSFSIDQLIEIQCGHTICISCFNVNKKENFIKCLICKNSLNISQFNVPMPKKDPVEAVKEPQGASKSQNIISKIQSEINILKNMISQVVKVQIDLQDFIEKCELEVNQAFSFLVKNLSAVQELIRSKISEIREANQVTVHSFVDVLNGSLDKRRNIMKNLCKALVERTELDFHTQLELNSLEILKSADLSLYKVEFLIDYSSLTDKISNTIIQKLKIERNAVEISNIMPDHPRISDSSQLKPENPDQKKDFNNSPSPHSNHTNLVQLKESEPETIDDYANKPISKNDLIAYRKNKIKRNPNNPLCEWFLELSEDIRQLPKFVCEQLKKVDKNTSIIHIKKDGIIINIADIKNMMYHIVDNNGSIIPDRSRKLIHLPYN